ncbi:MAG: TIGR03808 family TAT-translocated repetitive protein [Pseudomonadota bacterium]|nr:TIGR03808 family TAT-translocated repetitive protein [Pseudomonadota bacterium]
MPLDRRQVLLGGAGAGALVAGPSAMAAERPASAAWLSAREFGAVPDTAGDQTAALQLALDAASNARAPLFIPAGRYLCRTLTIKSGVILAGAHGATILMQAGDGPLLTGSRVEDVILEGLTFDGAKRPLDDNQGKALLVFDAVARLSVRQCRILQSGGDGLSLTACSGLLGQSEISGCKGAGLLSTDAKGMEISQNHVHGCADNGILIWRSSPGEDGTLVTGNRIEKIGAASGGSGQYGNGINLFRAGAVVVAQNRISDCAYTAVRANAASNCQIVSNSCSRMGEVAIYSEFGFEGALVSSNLVDGAASGISITNFDKGGRLAVVQGNLVRNLVLRKKGEARGIGISAEADSLIVGNVVEAAPTVGIMAGWGPYLRDVTVTANVVRQCHIGIGVSVTTGAGYALITDNMISQSANGAIRAMKHAEALGRDLAQQSSESFRNIAVFGNVAL